MRKLVINTDLRNSWGASEDEFIETAASLGWNGVFSDWSDGKNMNRVRKLTEANGLFLQSVHAPFTKIAAMWEEGEQGENELKRQLLCLNECAEIGAPIVVEHAIIGFDKHSPNALGIKRFETLANKAERLGIKLAVENTEGEEYLDRLLGDLKGHPAVGFCIDTGHEMCYNESRDLITKYARQLICTHLNDNMKITGSEITWLDDSHLMPFDGLADWQGIATRLNAANFKGELTFELTGQNRPERHTHDIYASLDMKGFLALALQKAEKFRAML